MVIFKISQDIQPSYVSGWVNWWQDFVSKKTPRSTKIKTFKISVGDLNVDTMFEVCV